MENDIIGLLEKLWAKIKDNMDSRELKRHLFDYLKNNIDNTEELEELNEGINHMLNELSPLLTEGKMSFRELLLLIKPKVRDALKYIFTKLLEESEQYNSPKIR